jgi:tripartite-type tricarboxylate transporter receptor subunit TctC
MKRLGALFGAATACLLFAGQAQAAEPYPSRTITMVVTAAAGGVTDAVARALAHHLQQVWKEQVVIENRGGAAHSQAMAVVARSQPDGYTLMVGEAGGFVINPAIYPKGKLDYDEKKDFIPVTGLVRINQAVLASNDLPVSSVKELIELAKKKPNELTYATAGIGSAPHMNIALLDTMAGIKMIPVHYRGAAPALNDVIAGHVKLMTVSVGMALPPYRAGKLKILGIGSAKRLPQVPDVPTVSETGLPGYMSTTWFGLFAPAGTPRDIVMKLNVEANKLFKDPAFQKRFMEPRLFEPLVSSPEEFERFIQAEIAKWTKVVKAAHIKID